MYRGGAWTWWGGGPWLGRDGLGVVEEGGGAEHGGDDGEEAEREHEREPGHRQIQHQLRAVEHRPQRHPLPFSGPSPRLRCAFLGESTWLYHVNGEADRAKGGGRRRSGGTRGAARAEGEAASRPPGRTLVPSVNRDAMEIRKFNRSIWDLWFFYFSFLDSFNSSLVGQHSI